LRADVALASARLGTPFGLATALRPFTPFGRFSRHRRWLRRAWQRNDMAESFVRTFKRDYVARMDLSDAGTVLVQLPAAFEHFNEVHPPSSLKMRSPREFRRHQAAEARQSTVQEAALHCE